jgi:dipeptidyl aminopeptidase/acylaminoacyl peptidase
MSISWTTTNARSGSKQAESIQSSIRFTQLCRINFDGTGLLRLTDADGMHSVAFSKDRTYYGIPGSAVFVAKGRDVVTDIWGVITKPMNFDRSKKYPVIENIYAGPQGSFVPKTFTAVSADQSLAELGFIVVHIDGMVTSNRSKTFHDVAFKNLGDAGFPDRILSMG